MIDINNLLKPLTLAKIKGYTKRGINKMAFENKLDTLQIDGVNFIIINNKAIELKKKKETHLYLEIKPSYFFNKDKLLTVTNYSKLMNISIYTVYDWIKKNKINHIEIDFIKFIVLNKESLKNSINSSFQRNLKNLI